MLPTVAARRRGSAKDEAGAQGIPWIEHEAVLAGPEGHPLDLGQHTVGRGADHPRVKRRAHDPVVA